VAPSTTRAHLEKVTDKVITCVTSSLPKFYLADFYRYWHEPDDSEVIQCLKEWRSRRFRSNIEPQEVDE
jgi:predicted phosphoribosyltransferase